MTEGVPPTLAKNYPSLHPEKTLPSRLPPPKFQSLPTH